MLGATYASRALTAPAEPQSTAVVVQGLLDSPQDAAPAGRSERLLARYQRAIRAWNANVEANPADYISATNLGTVYVGRARVTGDLDDYDRAMIAVERALGADPDYLPARQLHASILFAVHDFVGARNEAQEILADAPDQLQALATLGDASLELGDVDAARASYASLDRQLATPPVWSRLAHLAYVEGDVDRAIGLVQRAIDAVADEPPSEATAFYSFQLGELYRARDNLTGAEAAYEQALDDLPTYVPAMAGLAHVREAQGRRADAITLLEAATDLIPQPELVAALGDLRALNGDVAGAERAYALVERIGALARATGSVYNRQLVLFAADHDRDVTDAIAVARAELSVRHDVYAHDALAWALFKDGQLAEAAAEAKAALALGTPDSRISYHAGMIAAAQGRDDDARRLLKRAMAGRAFLPPLQVPIAEAALAALGGAS